MPTDGERVHIRPATRGDIRALVEISTTAVTEEEVRGFGRPVADQPWADAKRLSGIWQDPDRAAGEQVIVAELDGQIVAYVTVEDRGEALELINIEVARRLQGHGVGRALVRFVEAEATARGKGAVTLGTSRSAEGVPWKSLPWWQHLGYRITHEEENAWTRSIGPGAREIRMRKDLGPADDLVLRDVTPDDLGIFFEQQRDPEANRMAAFTLADPEDRAAFDEHWARIRADPSVTMKTILLGDRIVGSIGSWVDPGLGTREVTYWIAREDWGRGIATRALRAFLEVEPARPLFGRAALDNRASLRVLEKCGFVERGRARGYANARGAEIDEVVMVLEDRSV